MPAKIYISYRRDDDPAAAARVRDGLAPKFRHANLFIDVDNLRAGQRFDEELAKALAACDVLIAIIGPRWMNLLKDKGASGERDYVREEIAGALQRKIIVVPVRVGREGQLPPLPRAEDLPKDIHELVLYQKHDVTHERFGRDIAELSDAITNVRRSKRPQLAAPRVARGWLVTMTAIVVVAGYVAAHSLGAPVPWPKSGSGVEQSTSAATARSNESRRKAEDEATATAQADEARRKVEQEVAAKAQADAQRKAEEESQRDPALAVMPGSGQSFRDARANGQPCSFCPDMVVVPAGTFMMGSPPNEALRGADEGPQHPVSISRKFAVGKFATTYDEWNACVADGSCGKPLRSGSDSGRRPVTNVSWEQAKAYVAWLSRKTGKIYRLLTEAEREYVTRAGTTTPFWTGPSISKAQANYNSNSVYGNGKKEEPRQQTVPVGSLPPNPWGLYEVHGNVYEWVEDCAHDGYIGAPSDGSAWVGGKCEGHVLRGGSWVNHPRYLRSAHRGNTLSEDANTVGLRVARTIAP